jgi:hypothetical protein
MKPYVLSYADLVSVYGPKRAFRVLITVETVANIPTNISPTNQEERLRAALAALGCLGEELPDGEIEDSFEGEEILPDATLSGEERSWSPCFLRAMEALDAVAEA